MLGILMMTMMTMLMITMIMMMIMNMCGDSAVEAHAGHQAWNCFYMAADAPVLHTNCVFTIGNIIRIHSLIISREGFNLTLSILLCQQGWIS